MLSNFSVLEFSTIIYPERSAEIYTAVTIFRMNNLKNDVAQYTDGTEKHAAMQK
jgi:hypothetical protein